MNKNKYIKDYTKRHLETFRSLTQFSRCWGIIDSHLRALDRIKNLESELKYLKTLGSITKGERNAKFL